MNYRQTRNYDNLEKRIFDGVGQYDIPRIYPTHIEMPHDFVPFNAAATTKKRCEKGVHFFIDDYQFNRLWTNINGYVDTLSQFKCVFTPDFSTYTDFPKIMQIYNHYRKHWVGAYLQEKNINVIPTISWSTQESYEWCFDGEPEGGCVAISSVGCMNKKSRRELFIQGYKEMVTRLQPETILFYGDVPDECKGSIVRIKTFTDKFKEATCDGW